MQALSVYQSVLIYNGRANLFFQTLYKIAGVKMRREEKKKKKVIRSLQISECERLGGRKWEKVALTTLGAREKAVGDGCEKLICFTSFTRQNSSPFLLCCKLKGWGQRKIGLEENT